MIYPNQFRLTESGSVNRNYFGPGLVNRNRTKIDFNFENRNQTENFDNRSNTAQLYWKVYFLF